MSKHTFYACDCGLPTCQFCGGGLAFCTVCKGGEGSLTTDCCGRPITEAEQYMIYDMAVIDFVDGKWVLNCLEDA